MYDSENDMGAIMHLDGERRWCKGSAQGRIRVEGREDEGKDGYMAGGTVVLKSIVGAQDVVIKRN